MNRLLEIIKVLKSLGLHEFKVTIDWEEEHQGFVCTVWYQTMEFFSFEL